MKLIRQGVVAASDCDTTVKMSVIGAFSLVENMVTELMGVQKIDGVTCMREYGAMWVFVRNRIEIREPMQWMDAYTAECCISSFTKAKLFVDTVVRHEGRIAIASRLELCAVDLQTKRIRPTSTVGLGERIKAEGSELEIAYSRESYEPLSTLETVVVRSSDIDYCHHTNNISYIRYLMNRYSVKELEEHPIRAIEVQYADQTFEGETLMISDCGEDRFVIETSRGIAMRCKLEHIERGQ